MISIEKNTSEYSSILETKGITYNESEYYLHVSEPLNTQGWLLHLTVIHIHLAILLEKILPDLLRMNIPFKVIKSKQLCNELNLGTYGQYLIGKCITLYPSTDKQALEAAQKIIQRTADLKGPEIITDFHLGGIVYTRYGASNNIIASDENGNKSKLYFNDKGEPVIDQYYIPPQIPSWVNFPFENLIKSNIIYPKKQYNYILIRELKNDPKGKVFKALYFKYFPFRIAAIKQGKQNMWADDLGRNIKDRLLWQKELHEKLHSLIPIPRCYGYFEENGDSYLAMEFISTGKDFSLHCHELLSNTPWKHVSKNTKLKILNYILLVLTSIEKIHQQGLIHRDITGTNFLITKRNKVYLIDVELMYDTRGGGKTKPYLKGTQGFMSPQQENETQPDITDDIYSIGALIISTVTGMSPSFLLEENREYSREKLIFFIQDYPLADLLMNCIHADPVERPSLNKIMSFIQQYKSKISSDFHAMNSQDIFPCTKHETLETIKDGILALQGRMFRENGVWFSNLKGSIDITQNQLGNKSFNPGIYNGISGILFLFNKISQTELHSLVNQDIQLSAWEFIAQNYLGNISQLSPGLFHGTAGIALTIADSLKLNNTHPLIDPKRIILECLQAETFELDIFSGIAGKGMSCLLCNEYLKNTDLNNILHSLTKELITRQEKDGSWKMPSADKTMGFAYGVAGIVYFLLNSYQYTNDPEVLTSASLGLQFLIRNSIKQNRTMLWPISITNKTVNRWWCHGSPGIALTFIKAYELTGHSHYKLYAEKALRSVPEDFYHENLSQCHGMSGIGEIYLEAFRVFKNEEWLKRSSWIVKIIVTLKRHTKSNTLYWYTETPDMPTADFMTGNSGIVYFLLRHYYSDLIAFPFVQNK
ncbi:MAG: lanthionine synthetase LanC family protein, partial [Bacteroidota bacterium]